VLFRYLFTFLIGINLVLYVIIVFIILKNNRRRLFNQLISMICISVFGWNLSFFIRYGIELEPFILLEWEFHDWAKMGHVAGVYVTSFASYFLLVFPDRVKYALPRWFTVLHSGVIPTAMVFLIFSNLIVEKMVFSNGTYYIQPGPLHLLWNLYVIGFILPGLYVFIKRYLKASGLLKNQMRYVLAGVVLTGGIGTIFGIVIPGMAKLFPVFGPLTGLNRLGALGGIFFAAFSGIAILKYRLLDIEQVIARTAGYVFSLSVVGALYFGIIIYINKFLERIAGRDSFLIAPIGAISVAFLFNPLQKKIRNFVYEKLFAARFEYLKFLQVDNKKIVTILNLKEMVDFIVGSIYKNIGTESIAFLLKSKDSEDKSYGVFSSRGIDPDVCRDFKLSQNFQEWFEGREKVFIKEELKLDLAPSGFKKLYGNLGEIGAEVVLPVFVEKNIEGLNFNWYR